jgi:hypothetical protein
VLIVSSSRLPRGTNRNRAMAEYATRDAVITCSMEHELKPKKRVVNKDSHQTIFRYISKKAKSHRINDIITPLGKLILGVRLRLLA